MGKLTKFLSKLGYEKPKKQQEFLSLDSTANQIFKQDGDLLWRSDTLQACLNRCISELIKYKPVHTQKQAFGEYFEVQSNLQAVLDEPNAWETQADILEKFFYRYYLDGNAYMIPVRKNGKIEAFYTILPASVQHLEDAAGKEGYKFTFSNGYEVCLLAKDVIHLKRDFAINSYFGGNAFGKQDTNALRSTLKLNDTLSEGIEKTVESAYAVRGILKLNSYLDEEKQQVHLNNFYRKLKSGDSAFLVMDAKSQLEMLNANTSNLVDSSLLEYVDSKIARVYGVSTAVLNGDFTQEQLRAFQIVAIDGVIEKFEQELTKKLLSDKQKANGECIQCFYRDVRYVDSQTIQAVQILAETGSITQNEIRQCLGLLPLQALSTNAEGKPKVVMSKNFGSLESVQNQILVENGQNTDTNKEKDTENEGNAV